MAEGQQLSFFNGVYETEIRREVNVKFYDRECTRLVRETKYSGSIPYIREYFWSARHQSRRKKILQSSLGLRGKLNFIKSREVFLWVKSLISNWLLKSQYDSCIDDYQKCFRVCYVWHDDVITRLKLTLWVPPALKFYLNI